MKSLCPVMGDQSLPVVSYYCTILLQGLLFYLFQLHTPLRPPSSAQIFEFVVLQCAFPADFEVEYLTTYQKKTTSSSENVRVRLIPITLTAIRASCLALQTCVGQKHPLDHPAVQSVCPLDHPVQSLCPLDHPIVQSLCEVCCPIYNSITPAFRTNVVLCGRQVSGFQSDGIGGSPAVEKARAQV